jgi:phenylacetate-CoA ligase
MGVTFASRCMTVATTSVREDMAVALVQTFGAAYAQVLLVADPLFLKRLTDYAVEQGLDWRRLRMQAVVGEEVFGEHFRSYMARRLGIGRAGEPDTFLMSSFGVGELGLHLCYETRATVALRRVACEHADFSRDLLGASTAPVGMPMLFAYEPTRTYLEIDRPDADGYGRLTLSMLDPTLAVPLLRYQTGDVARALDVREVRGLLAAHGLGLPDDLPAHVIALRGRERETLANGAHVAVYKDAAYADHSVADRLTGAVRVTSEGTETTLHVQLVRHCTDDRDVAVTLRAALPAQARPRQVAVWRYEQFQFGMTLDYERKFASS